MKQYFGSKTIKATPMTRADAEALLKRDIGGVETGEGYLVEYENGYQSWSPKGVFDAAYRPVDALTFGLALEALKAGKRVARAGWNGKGMFVYHVTANSYPAQTGAAKAFFGESAMVPYNAYLAIKNVNDTVSTWVPSINDVLATDWVIVE